MRGHPRILIVDDDASVRRALTRLLAVDCDVVEAANAGEALRLLGSGSFDAVLTDHDMPGENGIVLLGHVRRRWPKVRRVLMSGAAHESSPTSTEFVECFLRKPVRAAELRRILLGEGK